MKDVTKAFRKKGHSIAWATVGANVMRGKKIINYLSNFSFDLFSE